MGHKVGVLQDGELSVHMAGVIGDYMTLCGLDGMDEAVGQSCVDDVVVRGKKIDCEQCRAIWEAAREYRAAQFS